MRRPGRGSGARGARPRGGPERRRRRESGRREEEGAGEERAEWRVASGSGSEKRTVIFTAF